MWVESRCNIMGEFSSSFPPSPPSLPRRRTSLEVKVEEGLVVVVARLSIVSHPPPVEMKTTWKEREKQRMRECHEKRTQKWSSHSSLSPVSSFLPPSLPLVSRDLQLDELVDVELLHRPIIPMSVRTVFVCVMCQVKA